MDSFTNPHNDNQNIVSNPPQSKITSSLKAAKKSIKANTKQPYSNTNHVPIQPNTLPLKSTTTSRYPPLMPAVPHLMKSSVTPSIVSTSAIIETGKKSGIVKKDENQNSLSAEISNVTSSFAASSITPKNSYSNSQPILIKKEFNNNNNNNNNDCPGQKSYDINDIEVAQLLIKLRNYDQVC